MTSKKRVQKFHTDDWWNLLQPIRSTTQIWVVTCHQYAISVLVSQMSFRRKTVGVVTKCHLFSLATPKGVMSQGYSFFQNNSVLKSLLSAFTHTQSAVADPGEGPGGPAPPPYLRVRMTAPPPLSEGLDPSLKFSCRVMEKIPNKFLQEGITLIIYRFSQG